jgi:hypothetical protein
MKMRPWNRLFQKRLHAEMRRILRLLERTRGTRRQVRLLVALETGTPRRKTARAFRARRLGR